MDLDISLDDLVEKNRQRRGPRPNRSIGKSGSNTRGRGASRQKSPQAHPLSRRESGGKASNSSFKRHDRATTGRAYSNRKNNGARRDPDMDDVWVHDKYFNEVLGQDTGSSGRGAAKAPLSIGTKIFVTNLDFGISSADLRELFSSVGPIKSAEINFTANGKSKGTGDVVFASAQHAKKAIEEFDQREVNGRTLRVMRLSGADHARGRGSAKRGRGGRRIEMF